MSITRTSSPRIQEVDWKNLGFGKIFSDHMLVMEYHNGAWQQPKIQPYGPLLFSPAISALHYGQALFEGMKAYRNEKNEAYVFRPEENAHRLNVSASRLCMPTIPLELFMTCLHALVELDKAWIPTGKGEALYIRPHMFAIDEYVGVKPSESYMFVIFTCPVGNYYTSELKVRIEKNYTRAANGGTGSAKAAGNYAAALLPTKKAQDEGFQQILWTDAKTHEFLE
ncbi:MAG: aminotransferase class IV, partial [Bacteroidota bacterium]